MHARLHVPIAPQPDDTTCGPTCLHAIYGYYGLELPLEEVIGEVPALEGGGTLAVLLATDALRRDFGATIVTYNLRIFDPTWFDLDPHALSERLRRQWEAKRDPKLRLAIEAYLTFLDVGGRLRFDNLTPALLLHYLGLGCPVMAGLSATFLYQSARELVENEVLRFDDVRGHPQGHFVVLSGYDAERETVYVADPLRPNPLGTDAHYPVDVHRLLNAIMLGVLTYDANLVVVTPRAADLKDRSASPPRRRQS